MGLFGSAKTDIIKQRSDGIVVAVTGGKAALKCELISMEEDEKNMTYPMVMTLNGVPLVQMHPSYCPTCCGLLATGYGLDSVKCPELAAISEKLNSGFEGIGEEFEVLRPLIGLLEDGIYLIRDTQTFPVDGDRHFFWDVPDELTYYTAFSDEFYFSELWKCADSESAFIYPTQSRDRYDESRVQHYIDLFSSGRPKPRAVAFNAMKGLSALLDGHHKACAAARLHAPLDTIVITKGHLCGARNNIHIGFTCDTETEYDVPMNKESGIPSKLYKQFAEQLARAFARKKNPPPELYKGVTAESRFTVREWEKCYTESVDCYPTAYQLAAESACGFGDIGGMTVEEIYSYVFEQEDPVFYARTLMSRFVRTNDSRTRELLTKFARLPFSGDTKQIIASALRCMMNMKDEETEKLFIDFVVYGDDYLSDIAKDYWEDAD
ncbi:MAG: hypothetical protein J5501_11440 [Ruminococcus sp.]|nr:hypothetical protein [Ruminococcus sp.]